MIVLSALTQAYSQGLKDTTRCYTPAELRVIALKILSGVECDTLLKISKLTITAQDTVIQSQSKTLILQENRYKSTERLVKEKEIQMTLLQKDLKKAKRRLVWAKVGWAATTIVLTVATVLTLVR